MCITIIGWLFFYAVLYNFPPSPIVLGWFRISYCGITFIAPTFFNYIVQFFKIAWVKNWNRINFLVGIIFSLLILKTNLIVTGLQKFYWGPYPKAGPLHPLYLFFFVSTLTAAIILIVVKISEKDFPSQQKVKGQYLLMAACIISIACLDFVPNYGIAIYPFGYGPTTLFLILIAYGIIKYQLMDIHIIFRKALVYSFLITSITIIYLVIVLLIEVVFREFLHYQSFAISIALAATIAACFMPLRNKIQNFVDRIFFQGSQAEIAEQNELLRQELARSEKLKMAATLASGLAHDIRNPLTALKTFAEHLPAKKHDPEFLNTFSNVVEKEVSRVDELVSRLLDFAKPAPPSFKSTEVHSLINDVLDLVSRRLEKQKITLIKEFESQPIHLNLDPTQIKQALINLIINAIDAMPNGGRLTIQTRINKDNKFLDLIISDTGCGISKKDITHIFDPFFSKKTNGTGLGLSITQGIIKEHKGRIRVTSEVNKGTTFSIELPKAGNST